MGWQADESEHDLGGGRWETDPLSWREMLRVARSLLCFCVLFIFCWAAVIMFFYGLSQLFEHLLIWLF